MSGQQRSTGMDRRGFVRKASGLMLAAAGVSLAACGEPLGFDGAALDGLRPSLALTAADDALTGTAHLIEKPAGSGQWRLARA